MTGQRLTHGEGFHLVRGAVSAPGTALSAIKTTKSYWLALNLYGVAVPHARGLLYEGLRCCQPRQWTQVLWKALYKMEPSKCSNEQDHPCDLNRV